MRVLLINANDAARTDAEKVISSNIKNQRDIVPSSFDNKKSLQLLINEENVTRLDESTISNLHGNDRKILSLLRQDNDECKNHQYTFTGLMRRLNNASTEFGKVFAQTTKVGVNPKV